MSPALMRSYKNESYIPESGDRDVVGLKWRVILAMMKDGSRKQVGQPSKSKRPAVRRNYSMQIYALHFLSLSLRVSEAWSKFITEK